jgi:tetratricopeptide (TPR) repeat protein
MKILVCIVILLTTISGTIMGQAKFLERAEAYYSIRQYSKAILDYERYFTKRNYSTHMLHWADAYRKTADLIKAEEIYHSYFDYFSHNDSLILIYADLLKQLGDYQVAKSWYLKGMESDSLKFSLYASYCDTAMLDLKNKTSIHVENLHQINSGYSEIAPVVYKNGLVFSSNREGTIIERKTDAKLPLFDLYIGSWKDTMYPEKVSLFSPELNSIHHECCASFSGDFNKIFFTRSFDKPNSKSPGGKNPLKMYSAIRVNNKWDSLQTFIFNDTTRSYGHPSVEANEEMFFFTADLEGGYGGTDIYVCFNVDGSWTNPINLGPQVNSVFNELYPFYHSDGTIYFSSNRPDGMGGYDLFKARENEDGEYGSVKNMGWPINSSGNDISIYWNYKKNVGYFSSDRKGGKGQEDIYIIKGSEP